MHSPGAAQAHWSETGEMAPAATGLYHLTPLVLPWARPDPLPAELAEPVAPAQPLLRGRSFHQGPGTKSPRHEGKAEVAAPAMPVTEETSSGQGWARAGERGWRLLPSQQLLSKERQAAPLRPGPAFVI